MKKLYFFFVILFFAAVSSYAQDTIVFRNGDEIQAKILEISDTEMKYKLWINQNGPIYTKRISDIVQVKYDGGYKEAYDQKACETSKETSSTYGNSIMDRRHYSLRINGSILSKEELKSVLSQDEYETYISSRQQCSFGLRMFISGVGLCALSTFFVFAERYSILCIIPIVVGDVLASVGIPFYFIGNGRLNWVVRNYNARVNGETVSMTFHPSLISSPNIAGSNSYCYGLGMTLSF